MNTKTGLFGLGFFLVSGALTISCGGTDDGGDDNTKAGTSSTAGSGGTSAGSSSGGTSSGSSNGGSSNGGSSNGGSSNGGSSNGGSSNGGSSNNSGGDDGGPGPGDGGDGPGPGGEDCPPAQPADDTACDHPGGFQNACPYDGTICTCQGQGDDRMWNCFGGPGGEGGAGPGGGGEIECPTEAPADGGDCGEEIGLCEYDDADCFCNFNGEWSCN